MIEFAWPAAFLVLPLPWLVHRFLPAAEAPRRAALRAPFLKDLENLPNSRRVSASASRVFWLAAIAWVFWWRPWPVRSGWVSPSNWP